MVGFMDKLLFSNNKKERTKDLPYFDKVKVHVIYWTPYQKSIILNTQYHLKSAVK